MGLSLMALSLTGSAERPANLFNSVADSPLSTEIRRANDAGRVQYSAGKYLEAREHFVEAASLSAQGGDFRSAAMNWNNAGATALARLDFHRALDDFLKAREIAQSSHQLVPLATTMNNLASLYLEMGNPEAAIQIASQALAGPVGAADRAIRPRLQFQLASALSRLNRYEEATAYYRAAVNDLEEQEDFDTTARILANWGSAALRSNRVEEAQAALTKALWLGWTHRRKDSANVLLGLAQVEDRMGSKTFASSLFDSAIAAPPGLTPRWIIYTERAQFRLDNNNLAGALEDFQEARKLAARMRADVVPADQDRVTLENDLNRIADGLVSTGNRIALQTKDPAVLIATFDTAEQDRLWSLRELIPGSRDWRTRLPDRYWDLLANDQSLERALLTQPSPEIARRASAVQLELAELEAAADPGSATVRAHSAFANVQSVLDRDTVLFSFYITDADAWLWAVDRHGLAVFSIPSLEKLKSSVAEFALATRRSDPRAIALGSRLYKELFGSVPNAWIAHKRWLLELDAPLFDLPFAALVVNEDVRKNEPIYLVERAALQSIPGALMLQTMAPSNNGGFLGIGDPVYNRADKRFKGAGGKGDPIALPRLPGTAAELIACSRASGLAKTQILTGEDARLSTVRKALLANPSIIHFATHVVPSTLDYSSGLIALSLEPSGAMSFMSTKEILAHPVSADLVVLNGCHSGQGDALPGAGLMGLTRAWIGAGAKAVLATNWDIPDEAGKTFMVDFYQASAARPDLGAAFALQQAQLAALREIRRAKLSDAPAPWAAYFLLGRQ